MNLTIIFEWILQLHSLWAILTMTIIFYTVLRFFFSALQTKIFKLLDLRIALFTLIFCHIQFVIGIISDLATISLKEELGFIFDLSKTTDCKYLEFLPFFLIKRTSSSLLIYQLTILLFSHSILTIAVPQLPPPSTAYVLFML